MATANSAIYGDREPSRAGEREPGAAGWIREGFGAALLLLGLYVAVSLGMPSDQSHLVGPAGEGIAAGLRFLFGVFVAWAVPLLLFAKAGALFMGRALGVHWLRALGVALVLLGVCGFLALPGADEETLRRETFERAGALGAFLVEWEGLRLVGMFGSVGAGMILGALTVAGVGLNLGLGLTGMAQAVVARWRERHLLAPAPEFAGLPSEDELAQIEEEHRSRPVRRLTPSEAATPAPDAKPAPAKAGAKADAAPLPRLLDNDAEAAMRALEEAEMDREFEEALRRELAGEVQPAAPPAEPRISLNDTGAPGLMSGNPANPSPAARPAPAQMEGKLSQMFPAAPARQRPAEAAPPPGTAAPDPRLDRVMKLMKPEAATPEPRFTAPGAARPVGPDANGGDPIFNAAVDAKPEGVAAAVERAAAPAAPAPRALMLPNIELLEDPPKVDVRMPREEMLEISKTLETTFADFGIEAKVIEVRQGPVVTRFELKPAAGVKVSRIASLEHDIAMAMKAVSVRILAPIPGKAVVGIEVPNRVRQGVYLKELIACSEFWEQSSPLTFALGKTIEGLPHFVDLRRMPHLLIAGATGTGKSVCLNSIICSILYRMRPDQVKLIMVDPKRVELSVYDRIPHLIAPVVCEPKRAAAALAWAVEQMEERYKTLVEFNVRNIDGYNKLAENPSESRRSIGKSLKPMPHMVVIVDELADLMITAKAEVEESIQRLAQMARAVGIHLILATQRPSVNVITGIIKANFPSRIAFQVSQKVDSRTILDQNGAEALLGRGDMLFAMGGQPKPIRLQGAFVSDQEVERITDHWRAQQEPVYEVEEFEPLLSEKERRELAKLVGNPDMFEDLDGQERFAKAPARGTNRVMGDVREGMFVPHSGGSAQAGDDEIDEALVRAAARVILEGEKGSTSLVQRRLKVGFARAGRLMDMLEDMGIVGPYKGSKPREILVDPQAALAELDRMEGADSRSRALARGDDEDDPDAEDE
ncbi:MAG: DNA translocase FtsK [Candidatus Sumerlaeia bacterium]|nr:DNA translocase FtsK [Candidatus Sumerlaeia bacterium]